MSSNCYYTYTTYYSPLFCHVGTRFKCVKFKHLYYLQRNGDDDSWVCEVCASFSLVGVNKFLLAVCTANIVVLLFRLIPSSLESDLLPPPTCSPLRESIPLYRTFCSRSGLPASFSRYCREMGWQLCPRKSHSTHNSYFYYYLPTTTMPGKSVASPSLCY